VWQRKRTDSFAGRLAWLVARSPLIVPIPGTAKWSTLSRMSRAAAITLTEDEFNTLHQMGGESAIWIDACQRCDRCSPSRCS
jgi:aryl-alcohol dehydrogenase-like predicted oxidoreductase